MTQSSPNPIYQAFILSFLYFTNFDIMSMAKMPIMIDKFYQADKIFHKLNPINHYKSGVTPITPDFFYAKNPSII